MRIAHQEKFFKADKKLAEYTFNRRLDSAKPDCDKVLLTETDTLFVSRAGANSASERFDVDKEQWTISGIDRENETISLFRQNFAAAAPLFPQTGISVRAVTTARFG